jgi:aminotransferase
MYAAKRQVMAGAARAAGMDPILPQGAYYMLADCRSLAWGNARETAHRLLRETGVAAVPGSAFYRGDTGDHLLRFCFAKDDGSLGEAARRLGALR